jgi:hypothetical protein
MTCTRKSHLECDGDCFSFVISSVLDDKMGKISRLVRIITSFYVRSRLKASVVSTDVQGTRIDSTSVDQ